MDEKIRTLTGEFYKKYIDFFKKSNFRKKNYLKEIFNDIIFIKKFLADVKKLEVSNLSQKL